MQDTMHLELYLNTSASYLCLRLLEKLTFFIESYDTFWTPRICHGWEPLGTS